MNARQSWCADTPLSEVTDLIQYGYTAKSSHSNRGPRYLRITDIQNDHVEWNTVPHVIIDSDDFPQYRLRPGDIVFARSGATVGKSFLIRTDPPGEAIFASYLIRVRCAAAELDAEYAAFFFKSEAYWRQISEGATGTGQPNFNGTKLGNLRIPVRPLEHQRKIVNKLDLLLTRSKSARSELTRIPRLVERYKQAILAAAFRGGLTAAWRRSAETTHAEPWPLPPTWAWRSISDVAEVASNLIKPAEVPDLPHIAPNHIESGIPRLLSFKTVKEDGVTSAKHRFFPGQIIYSKIRPYLRKAVIVDFEGVCSADMYPINARCDTRYLLWWLLSSDFNDFAMHHQGRTVLPKINQNALYTIPIPVPPREEQAEITRRIDEAFKRVDSISLEAVSASKLLDRLELATLAKAFEGDLVIPEEKIS